MPDQPNVLFVMDDQHSARCLGGYGNDDVQTPNLDSLAEEGARFERAYCNNPICLPSRMCYLTGRYAHSLGIYGNYGGVPDDTISMPHHFRTNGYDTGGFGKMHIPVDWATHGFETRQDCDYADTRQWPEENDYYSYLKRLGYAEDYDMGVGGSRNYPHSVFDSEIPAEHSVEAWTADRTIQWIDGRDGDDPFFAWMSFQRPHPPYAPPPEYTDLYDPDEIELPPRDPGEFADKPGGWQNRAGNMEGTSDEDLRQAVAYYYALITLIDEQIGRVLDHLEEQGELDNTIVAFVSDHGDFAGEHGFVRKNVGISEAVHRVPMIWRFPDGVDAGVVNEDLVESVDTFPTFCDLAGLPTPDPVQGRSLTDALTGGSIDRDAVYCETPNHKTVRTEEYKLTHYVDNEDGELYHVAEDPWEHDNLYHDAEYADVRLDLQEMLLDFFAETEEPVIPGNSGIPPGTPSHHVWQRKWWEEGGYLPKTPLAHLGGPEGAELEEE
jgi:choline-sulfatase/uncharacterized sulfatase